MLKYSYQRFKAHYNEKGLLYALYRGFKYLLFVVKKTVLAKQPKNDAISCGRLRVVCNAGGIKLYHGDIELTANIGLNVAICTLTSWADSSKGKWEVLRRGSESLMIKNRWDYLPLTLIWHLTIRNETKIIWKIELEAEENIKIDRVRAIIILSQTYNNWSMPKDAKKKFLPADDGIKQEYFNPSEQSLSAWSDADKNHYPAIKLSFWKKEKMIRPLAQQLEINDGYMHLLGIDITDGINKEYYLSGKYDFLSAEIDIVKDSGVWQQAKPLEAGKEFNLRNSGLKKDMRILLLNLPWYKNGKWGVRAGSRWPHLKDDAEEGHYLSFPFFLAYAASLLKKHGFSVYLIDALAEKIMENQLRSRIKKFSPDLLVAETSTPSLHYDLALLGKLGNDNFSICLCGPEHNMREPDFLINHKFIDYILIGEYEYSLLNLVECISKNESLGKVKGLIYRQKDKIITNPPGPLIELDTLPWPLREGIPMHNYMDTPGGIPLPSVQMLASRGCPFKCKFCLWPQVMYGGNTYRARNVIDVVDEMEHLVKEKGFKSVYFDDDTFNVGKERMLRFCSEIKKRNLNNIPWAIMARPDLMDEETLVNMKEAGLAAVKYGIESACQQLLDNCMKNMDLKKAHDMILVTKGLDIKTHLTFTFGLPGETRQTIRKTTEYALKLHPFSVQFSITTPFPGTQYFNELDSKGLIINKNWDDYDGNFKSVIKLDSLDSKDLESARKNAYALWNESFRYNRKFKENWSRLGVSYRQGGLSFALKKAIKYLKERKTAYILKRIKDDHLDTLGIFDGKYAFKGPATVQIDLTDQCNNNCIACWCNSPLLSEERRNQPKNTLPKGAVKNLIAELSRMGTREIFFSGGGEPFMHPDLLEIITYAKKIGFYCSINTNFTLVNEEIIQKLLDIKLDYLTVSVWAGTAQTYKATHPNKTEREFVRIRDMLVYLSSRKKIYPQVKIYNVISNINYREIKAMLNFACDTKADFVEFTVVDTIPGATDRITLSREQGDEVLRQFKEVEKDFISSNFNFKPQILTLEHFLRRLSNLDSQQAEYDSKFIDTMPCYIGWLFARIMPNGDVNSCLKSHRYPIGNIHEHSFKEIWNSGKQVYFRKKTVNRRKDDSFFTLIGNDPNAKVGCYKSCDDIGRNMAMHDKIIKLSSVERYLYKIFAKSLLARLIMFLNK